MPPKAKARGGSQGSVLARGGAAVLSGNGSRSIPSKRNKAVPEEKRQSSKAKLETEALEVFERYEPDGKADGTLKLAQFAQVIRDMNVKKMLIWGDEPGPVVKEEWTKVGGLQKREVTLADFTAWWPTFLVTVEARIADVKAEQDAKEDKERAARQAKADRCSGDGVWSIPLNDLEFAMEKAREKGKTPLLIDNTQNQVVETFFVYRSVYVVECKKLIMEKATKKAAVEDILKGEQERFFRANCFKHGQTVVFRLATSACDLMNTFNSEAFPSVSLLDAQEVAKVQGVENASKFKDSPFFKMCPDDESRMEHTIMGIHENFNVLVITQFKEEDYEGFLKEMIPLHLLQPIKPVVEE